MNIYESKREEALQMLRKAAAEVAESPIVSSDAFKSMENSMKIEAEEAKAVASLRKLLMYYSREVPVSSLIPSEIARVIITDFIATLVKDESHAEFKKAYLEMIKDEDQPDEVDFGIVMDEDDMAEISEEEADEQEYDFQDLIKKLHKYKEDVAKQEAISDQNSINAERYAKMKKKAKAKKKVVKSGNYSKAQERLMAGRASKVAEYTARYTPMSSAGIIHQQFDLTRIEY